MAEAKGAKVHFIGVGTPQQKDGYAADLTYVNAAVDALLPYLNPGDIVAGKVDRAGRDRGRAGAADRSGWSNVGLEPRVLARRVGGAGHD